MEIDVVEVCALYLGAGRFRAFRRRVQDARSVPMLSWAGVDHERLHKAFLLSMVYKGSRALAAPCSPCPFYFSSYYKSGAGVNRQGRGGIYRIWPLH